MCYSTRTFSCPNKCGKEFATYNEIQNHINYCSLSQYRCKVCDKGFMDEKPFLTHLAECHPRQLLLTFNKAQPPNQVLPSFNNQPKQNMPPCSSNFNIQTTTAYTNYAISNFCPTPTSSQREEKINFFFEQGKRNSNESFPRNPSACANSCGNGGATITSYQTNYSNVSQNGSAYMKSFPNTFSQCDQNGGNIENISAYGLNSNSNINMMKYNEENKEYMF